MRIHRLLVRHSHMGNVVTWHASERGARSAGRAHKRHDREVDGYDTAPVDFTPTKVGILALLNDFTPDRDNG